MADIEKENKDSESNVSGTPISEPQDVKLSTKRQHYMNNLNLDTKNSMKNRILVSIFLVLVCVPCIVLGNYVFATLILLASSIACHEIIKAPQSIEHKFSNLIYIFSYLMMFILIYWVIVKNNLVELGQHPEGFVFDLSSQFNGPRISLTSFFICMAFFFLNVIIDKNFSIHDAFYFVTMLFIVSVGFQSILYLRYCPFTYSSYLNGGETYTYYSAPLEFRYGQSILLILYMLIGACMNDVGAYFIGVLFGKHKMSPRISPKKTYEGLFGGIIISFVCSGLFALILDLCNVPILAGILDINHFYNIIILSLLIPLCAVFGDLIFSAIKRYYKIKDFGTALKSHGGILDRLDSILIVSIMMSLFIEVMSKNWNFMSTGIY